MGVVYVAEVTQNLLMERDELKRYFDQAGYRVLPDKPLYSPDPDAYKTAVCKELAQCRIFIQLLSRLPNRLHSEQPCYSRLQYECAKESGKPVFQWRNPDFNPDEITKDPDHKKLLRADTVMAVNIEDFKREVLQNASKKKSDIPVQDAFVYLNANSRDAYLRQDVPTASGGTDVQVMTNFELKTKLVDALLSCASMSLQDSRNTVVNELRPDIKSSIMRSSADRIDVVNIVNRCLNFPDGISELVSILRTFERGSIGMKNVNGVVDEHM
ncbi:MAG: hypothetical protein GY749_17200 [Desulfobacteraceae bacterium]|nr:hypothetical protein [Desulfobacteraceae bacterium]